MTVIAQARLGLNDPHDLQDVGDGQTVACHLIDEPERDRP
jgi:hypothetical protein